MQALVSLRDICKVFKIGGEDFFALNQVSLSIGKGEFLAITGRSGSGKSTLLNMITAIDRPSQGGVWVNETALHLLSEDRAARWRGRNLGIVFQFFQLIPTLSLLENVVLPMDFAKLYGGKERVERAVSLLERVGLAEQMYKLPGAVSGGQQQRAALARALANDPPLLVADEPTGNLDSTGAQAVLALFRELSGAGKTIVMVTHDQELARQAHRVVQVADGRIAGEGITNAV